MELFPSKNPGSESFKRLRLILIKVDGKLCLGKDFHIQFFVIVRAQYADINITTSMCSNYRRDIELFVYHRFIVHIVLYVLHILHPIH